jgi:hypothetical protein
VREEESQSVDVSNIFTKLSSFTHFIIAWISLSLDVAAVIEKLFAKVPLKNIIKI